ncbi:hypothetical protein CYMTET_42008 [Cymbomonas tetramitiformis]|uniref:Uncharacterized protein n=1 Tax=Cymbomonas tetramitiformis TaxID=36881 RepID=A0AAE0C6N4_9CHLO|nr:hypothetical protein CYMTET_42008 [Cymbomonas tetramitiformis]
MLDSVCLAQVNFTSRRPQSRVSRHFAFRLRSSCKTRGVTWTTFCTAKDESERLLVHEGQSRPKSDHPLRLVLLRHAKSSWDIPPSYPDKRRPLSSRGYRSAIELGRLLDDEGWIPDLVLCSDALRAQQTVQYMCIACERLTEVRAVVLSDFYSGSTSGRNVIAELKEHVVREASATDTTVLCVGHNDGWEQAASILSERKVQLRTANAALLEITEAENWKSALSSTKWNLCNVLTVQDPREEKSKKQKDKNKKKKSRRADITETGLKFIDSSWED